MGEAGGWGGKKSKEKLKNDKTSHCSSTSYQFPSVQMEGNRVAEMLRKYFRVYFQKPSVIRCGAEITSWSKGWDKKLTKWVKGE